MAVRRRLGGTPLLVASAAVAFVVGCGGTRGQSPEPVGNLMAPPRFNATICVDTDPAGGTVSIDGKATTGRCTGIEGEGVATVTASHSGDSISEQVVYESGQRVEVTVVIPQRAPPPMGNLMPPPELDPPEIEPPIKAPE